MRMSVASIPLPSIAVTVGEPAGIGPELCVRLAERKWSARLVLIGDLALLRKRALRLDLDVSLVPYHRDGAPPNSLEVLSVPLANAVVPGRLDPANAKGVLATLDAAVAGCESGEFAAMVTAPVQKSIINDAGIAFSGHTEYLAKRTRTAIVVMMLVGDTPSGPLRVALMTTHIPLAAVARAITHDGLVRNLRIVAADLRDKFGIAAPRIAVCGLNPHAGEGGYLGREEIDVIEPALTTLRSSGIDVSGPLPADTIFVSAKAQQYDCIAAMYHDQGLPVLKRASFGHGVNVTLGLPFPRTSVDHGTALDLAVDAAGVRSADPGSLFAAVDLAIELATELATRRTRLNTAR